MTHISAMKTPVNSLSVIKSIDKCILFIRNQKVILDADLAFFFGVSTKRLNEQIKRNLNRFPEDFMFSLNQNEKNEVVAFCDHLHKLKYSPVFPKAFTEHGVLMAANYLNSQRAAEMSIYIVRAFIRMRDFLQTQEQIWVELKKLQKRVGIHDQVLDNLFDEIKELMQNRNEKSQKRKIGFQI